jgi:gluconolactonase
MTRYDAVVELLLLVLLAPVGCAATGPIVEPGTEPAAVAEGYQFTEGPVADADGNILFSDVPNSRIYRFHVDTGKTALLHEDTGGANGLAFDPHGRLVACAGETRALIRFEPDGTRTVLADEYRGKKLNSPNDLVIDDRGGIYFTDPHWKKPDQVELDFMGVYYLDPDGELHLLATHHKRPNGVTLSPDGATLYVNDNDGPSVWAYDVKPDGTVGEGRVFAELPAARWKGPDGATVDTAGNVYVAHFGFQVVRVYSPEGEQLLEIPVPAKGPSNVAFGGVDRTTLYITAGGALYAVPTHRRGVD